MNSKRQDKEKNEHSESFTFPIVAKSLMEAMAKSKRVLAKLEEE